MTTRDRSNGGWSSPGELSDPDEHPFRAEKRYDEIELVARGGMGEVVVVHDRRLGRDIALKRVPPELDNGSDRLAREAWITARLEHPSIVPVHDAGEDEQGRLFYTMRLIHGCSLAEAIETRGAGGQPALLRHYLAACEAVAYAHSHGIVHRDLKPANIMVGAFGETQVVDWGLAGLASEAARGTGTPGYMSPEQITGDGPIDARSDVWALGAVLHEIVHGARFQPSGERPSGQLELSAIVDRATQPDRRARYRDAGELAADVTRFLDGRRVSAHAYSTFELARRLARQLRVPLFVIAGGLVAAAVVLIASFHRIDSARDRAVVAEGDAQRALGEQERTSAQALSRQAITELGTGALAEAEVLAAHALVRSESPDARGVIAAVRAAPRLTGAQVILLRGCERVIPGNWHLAVCHHADGVALWDLDLVRERWRVPVRARQLVVAEHAGALQVLALVGADELLVLDGATGLVVRRDRVEVSSGLVEFLVVSRDGRHLLASDSRVATTIGLADDHPARHSRVCDPTAISAITASRRGFVIACLDGSVRELELETHTLATRLTSPILAALIPTAIALAPDERTLIAGGVRGEVAIADLETSVVSPPRATLDGRIAQLATLTPGIERVAIRGEVGGTGVWDLASGSELLRLPDATNVDVRLDARGLISGGRGVGRWTLPARLMPHVFVAPKGISSIAAAPDGRYLAAARGDGKISIWDVATGRVARELELGNAVVKTVDFSRDSRELAASLSMSLHPPQRFAVESWEPIAATEVRRTARRLAYTRDGSLLAVHYAAPMSRWDPSGQLREIAGPEMFDLASSPDRETLWLLASDGGVWRMRGDLLEEVARDRNASSVAAFGERVATGHDNGIAVHETGRSQWFPTAASTLDLIISPEGRYLIAAHSDGTISVRRFSDGTLVATLRGHRQRVAQLAFLPDGRLASAGWDGRVHTWELSMLEVPARQLVDEAERAWALDLPMALRR